MTTSCVPIIVYHHVYQDEDYARLDPCAGVIDVTTFKRQMQLIEEHNYTCVSTTDVTHWLADAKELPEKAIVIHFDNGWLDTATVALPILKERGLTALCYPITDGIEAATGGKTATVTTTTQGTVSNPFMTWAQLQELLDAGWEIGNHTATHPKIADHHAAHGDAAVVEEIETSNALFEKHLGRAPRHFAYPSGSHSPRTDELLSPYFDSLRLWAFSEPIVWDYATPDTSPHAIPSQNIDYRVSEEDFVRVLRWE